MMTIGRMLSEATNEVLLIDPYLDEKAITDFVVLARENIAVRLLADEHYVKSSLKPAVTRWVAQYGATRPVEARLTGPRALHDRLIMLDGDRVWSISQSFNALAARSPASVLRIDPGTAALKVAAYAALWQAATSL
jgi:hypothetical protein